MLERESLLYHGLLRWLQGNQFWCLEHLLPLCLQGFFSHIFVLLSDSSCMFLSFGYHRGITSTGHWLSCGSSWNWLYLIWGSWSFLTKATPAAPPYQNLAT